MEDEELAVREESAGRWASCDVKGSCPEMMGDEAFPRFSMLTPPPSRRVSRMQSPVAVTDIPYRWVPALIK